MGPLTKDAELTRLLQTADVAYAVNQNAPSAAALCEAARRRRLRSRGVSIASAALGAALVIAIMSASGPKPSRPVANGTVQSNAADELRQALDALNREAEQRRQVVLALRQSEQLAARQAELESLASKSALPSAIDESSRSAAISLQYASLVEQESRDAEQARLEYERVAARFPGTKWATAATDSLQRLASPTRLHPSL